MVTLDKALDVVMELSPDEQEMLLGIVKKRRVEARRTEIAESFVEAKRAWRAGELKVQTADELIADLHMSLEDPE
ncbi:hypothetical protein BH24DEI2_BH24DEI2_20730 [soil metagenome]